MQHQQQPSTCLSQKGNEKPFKSIKIAAYIFRKRNTLVSVAWGALWTRAVPLSEGRAVAFVARVSRVAVA